MTLQTWTTQEEETKRRHEDANAKHKALSLRKPTSRAEQQGKGKVEQDRPTEAGKNKQKTPGAKEKLLRKRKEDVKTHRAINHR